MSNAEVEYWKGQARQMMVHEAIANIAMSHDEPCSCNVCRASKGDASAFNEIYEAVLYEIRKQEGA